MLGKSWCREEDHLALMMELLGDFPRSLLNAGKFSNEFFTRSGELKRIRQLNYWSLRDVLREKYKFPDRDAKEAAEFLEQLLVIDPRRRATAEFCLNHSWIGGDKVNMSADGKDQRGLLAFDDNMSEVQQPGHIRKYFDNKHCS